LHEYCVTGFFITALQLVIYPGSPGLTALLPFFLQLCYWSFNFSLSQAFKPLLPFSVYYLYKQKNIKIMKTIVTGIIALTAFIFSANAQQPGKMMHHKQHHQMGMMMKGINFSDAQKAQLKANRENAKQQMIELNKNENITVKEYRVRKEAIHKSQKEQMDQLLTPEQKNQLAQNKIELQKKHEMNAAKRMNKMKNNLNLSNDQMNQLKANRDTSQAKIKAIKENNQLSQTEKKAQLMALKEAQKKNIQQVLTPEQLSKMEEIRNNHMEKSRRK
jgi:Spy/CpxP family protein refolding chaperone